MFTEENLKNNVIFYYGPINIDMVSFMSNYIKQHVNASVAVLNKIYKVFIELTQNVSYYSANQYSDKRSFGSGVGWFKIDNFDDFFLIMTGNLIYKEHRPILQRNGEEINSLEEEELRDLKRKTRGLAAIKDIGAHIGLIQTGLITGNPLELSFSQGDSNHLIFTITAKVNKR
ncbi:MAG: SiaB family protein kinase [Bacteroidales bacterium]|nr:SiaB family protein kinase [Bacteroidales bacterium]